MADPPPPAQRQDGRTGRTSRRRRRRGKPGDPQRRAIRQAQATAPREAAGGGGAAGRPLGAGGHAAPGDGVAMAGEERGAVAVAGDAGPVAAVAGEESAAAVAVVEAGAAMAVAGEAGAAVAVDGDAGSVAAVAGEAGARALALALPGGGLALAGDGAARDGAVARAGEVGPAGEVGVGAGAPGLVLGEPGAELVRRAGEVARQVYAAIDLGTNNCRLLIARPTADGFVVIDAFSRVVRLGEGLAQTGRLSDAAMDRALGALRVCGDKLRRRNVHLARSVATEACRRAANGADFVARVRAETGIALDIISAEEEARLAVLGCHILLGAGEGPALIFDIGGGSTELVLIEGDCPRILDWVSVPWGVVSLSEMSGPEGADAAARRARYAAMRARVAESFAGFAARVAGRAVGPAPRLLGTSGTVTTLASVHLDLPQYDRAVVDGVIVPAAGMRAISARLSAMSISERRALPCIGRERADLVVAGCAILEAILDLWPTDRLGVADRGIREGILRGLINGRGAVAAGEAGR